MSFFDVVTKHRGVEESEKAFARRIGQAQSTLRSWKLGQPLAVTVFDIAVALGESPVNFFLETIADVKNEPEILNSANGSGCHCDKGTVVNA